MKIKRTTTKRLASISALGAGAMVGSVSQIQAGVIETDLNPVKKVGFSLGFSSSYMLTLHGTAAFTVQTTGTAVSAVGATSPYVKFAGLKGPGQSFGGVGGSIYNVLANGSSTSNARTLYTNKFLLFKFKDSTAANAVRFGWLEVSAALNASGQPDVTLSKWAYDDSGAQIVTPLASTSTAPEPASLGMCGIGALVLGAAGVRRWRAAKDAQKTA